MSMYIAGNWKMNTLCDQSVALASQLVEELASSSPDVKVMIAPPFTAMAAVASVVKNTPVYLGVQNIAFAKVGAYTGEISADMARDVGAQVCIIGHSERRIHCGETNDHIREKIHRASEAGMEIILCVGETLQEREGGREKEVVSEQLSVVKDLDESIFQNLTIAYEPVWAINTGKAATAEDAQEIHFFIREKISQYYTNVSELCIQYGGSVNPSNAAELLCMPDIDGALVGGASLDAPRFLSIVALARKESL